MENNEGIWEYQYDLKDHLGNVRVSFDKHPTTGVARLIQKDDYYPFGLTFNLYPGYGPGVYPVLSNGNIGVNARKPIVKEDSSKFKILKE